MTTTAHVFISPPSFEVIYLLCILYICTVRRSNRNSTYISCLFHVYKTTDDFEKKVRIKKEMYVKEKEEKIERGERI